MAGLTNDMEPKSPKEQGEIESLVDQNDYASEQIEKELDMLINRLGNVLPDVAPAGGDPVTDRERKTSLGRRLDSMLYRNEKTVAVIQTIREQLEN